MMLHYPQTCERDVTSAVEKNSVVALAVSTTSEGCTKETVGHLYEMLWEKCTEINGRKDGSNDMQE